MSVHIKKKLTINHQREIKEMLESTEEFASFNVVYHSEKNTINRQRNS